MKNLKASALFLMLMTIALPAFAQGTGTIVLTNEGPRFFISIISGLILAFGFQTLLTVLSLAMGLSLTPNLMKAEARRKIAALEHDEHVEHDHHEHEHDHSTSLKITNSLGIWSLVTTSVALFAASWLAIRLSLVRVDEYAMIAALVIWASFLVVMTYLEFKTVRSLFGGITSMATAGLRSGMGMLHSVTGKSQARQMEKISRSTVRGIYEEISDLAHRDKLDRKIGKYLQELKPQNLDFDKIHDEVVDLLQQIRIEENTDVHEDEVSRVLSLKLNHAHHIDKDQAMKLASTVRRAARKARDYDDPTQRAIAAAEALVPLSEEQVEELHGKIGDFLKKLDLDELKPDDLYADLEAIIHEPKAALDVVRARLSQFDSGTVKALLAEYAGIEDESAEKIVNTVMGAIDKMRYKYEQTVADVQDRMEDEAETSIMMPWGRLPQKIERRLAQYFDSLGRPELNYQAIKMDIEDILHDPKTAPSVLKNRLNQMDQDSVMALLESNPYINHTQAQNLTDYVIDVRDMVSDNVSRLQDRAMSQYEQVRLKALLAAEHARESTIAAAWWTVGTAVVSGFAAVLGGYLASGAVT